MTDIYIAELSASVAGIVAIVGLFYAIRKNKL